MTYGVNYKCPPFLTDTHFPIVCCHNETPVALDLCVTIDELESINQGYIPVRLADRLPQQTCSRYFCYRDKRAEEAGQQVVNWGYFWDPPSHDPSRWGVLPDHDFTDTSMGVPKWKKSHLLSLPAELRLEIWKWTLTDPSVPDLLLNIERDDAQAPPHQKRRRPRIKTSLQPKRNSPIAISLLQTNRLIYEEALPILYESIRFAPRDHKGMFPLFLDSLSPYGRSLIRHVHLEIPISLSFSGVLDDKSAPLFHWTVTCAQVAKMNDQIQDIKIEGTACMTDDPSAKITRAVLFPLCKIKAKKIFDDEAMDQLLDRAEEQYTARVLKRRLAKEAEAAKRAATDASGSDNEVNSGEVAAPSDEVDSASQTYPLPVTLESTIDTDLSRIRGISTFERELDVQMLPDSNEHAISSDDEDWDLISIESGASTPRSPSYISRQSTGSWTDAGSVITAVEETFDDEDTEVETQSERSGWRDLGLGFGFGKKGSS